MDQSGANSPWETMVVDGEWHGDMPDAARLIDCIALHIGGEDALVYNSFVGVRNDPVKQHDLLGRIADCTPSVGALYRMRVQYEELVASGAFSFASDDPIVRTEQILTVAAAVCDATRLPAAVVGSVQAPNGEQRLVYYGMRQVPLYELWQLFQGSVRYALSQ